MGWLSKLFGGGKASPSPRQRQRKYKYSGQPKGKRFEWGEVEAGSREEARAKLEALEIEIRTLEEKSE